MGKFKEYLQLYLKENEDIFQQILDILDELSEEDLDDFGQVLIDEFLEEDPKGEDEEESDDEDYFDVDDIKEMLAEIPQEYYDVILDLLSPEEFEGDDDSYEETDGNEFETEDLGEAVSRRMKVKTMNKKKRKFQTKTKAQLRRGKAQRKVQARKDKPKKKRYYRANKMKLKAHKKSYTAAIKKGKHNVKLRRQ